MDHCDTQAAITIIEEKVTRNSFLHHLDTFSYILSSVQKEALLNKAIKKGIICRWIDIDSICNTFPEGLSHDLSEYLCAKTLPNLLENYKGTNSINDLLETLVLQLHPKSSKAFHRLGKLWEKAAESNQNINHFISIYQFRVSMYKVFNQYYKD